MTHGEKKQTLWAYRVLKIDMELFDYPIPEIKVRIPRWGTEEMAEVSAVAQVAESDSSYKQSCSLWEWNNIETIEELEQAKKEAKEFIDEFKKDRKKNWNALFAETLEEDKKRKEEELKTHNKRVRKELEETTKRLGEIK